jgi:hypothetical protein
MLRGDGRRNGCQGGWYLSQRRSQAPAVYRPRHAFAHDRSTLARSLSVKPLWPATWTAGRMGMDTVARRHLGARQA